MKICCTFALQSSNMKYLLFSILLINLLACKQSTLPYLGHAEEIDGQKIYPTIPAFQLMNQDSSYVNHETLKDKIYVADFIFLSCPTICPVMTREMYKVYETYLDQNQVVFISHTIDPDRDSIPRLKQYATNLGVSTPKWNFVTGEAAEIYRLAEESYFSTALPDSTAPGGFIHSGGLLLIDPKKHIRGVYDGTNPQETNRLIKDIKILLKELN